MLPLFTIHCLLFAIQDIYTQSCRNKNKLETCPQDGFWCITFSSKFLKGTLSESKGTVLVLGHLHKFAIFFLSVYFSVEAHNIKVNHNLPRYFLIPFQVSEKRTKNGQQLGAMIDTLEMF